MKDSAAGKFWLVKSEPDCYSIDDLKKDHSTIWDGVRNYQARNYLVEMQPGDKVLFYHSSTQPAGVAGLAVVAKPAAPDPRQFLPGDEYYDPKATRSKPRWFAPTLRFEKKFDALIPLSSIKSFAATRKMAVTQTGSRLSVNPVQPAEFSGILLLAGKSRQK